MIARTGSNADSSAPALGLIAQSARNPDDWAIRSQLHTHHSGATWAEAASATLRIAAAVQAADLGEERRVLVVARNRPATLIAHAGILLGEASSVPVSFHLNASEINYIATTSRAQLAFVDSSTVDAVTDAVRGLDPGHQVRIVQLPDHDVYGAELDAFIDGRPALVLGPDQRVIPSLLFTSGTTGRPKAVQLPPKTIGTSPTLGGLIEHMAQHRMAALGPHLVVGPLYHNGPLTAVRLMLSGVPIVVADRFDASDTLALIEQNRIESSIMVPTHFVRMLDLADDVRQSFDVTSLRAVAHTGGKCAIDVKQAMIEWWGPVLSESYGGTESGTVCSINSTDWLAHPGSVGRAVAPFSALVIDADGNEVGPNVEGRLYFRDATGRGIVYEDDPDKTAAAHIAPGVFTLGEIGYTDDEGFVFITDRFSDMVVSGGVNVYPAEAEQALALHPDVADVACIGVPDREMGERLVALVELVDGVEYNDDALASRLKDWCQQHIAGYKCPREFHLVDAIPRNPMGKIDKGALRAAHQNG